MVKNKVRSCTKKAEAVYKHEFSARDFRIRKGIGIAAIKVLGLDRVNKSMIGQLFYNGDRIPMKVDQYQFDKREFIHAFHIAIPVLNKYTEITVYSPFKNITVTLIPEL